MKQLRKNGTKSRRKGTSWRKFTGKGRRRYSHGTRQSHGKSRRKRALKQSLRPSCSLYDTYIGSAEQTWRIHWNSFHTFVCRPFPFFVRNTKRRLAFRRTLKMAVNDIRPIANKIRGGRTAPGIEISVGGRDDTTEKLSARTSTTGDLQDESNARAVLINSNIQQQETIATAADCIPSLAEFQQTVNQRRTAIRRASFQRLECGRADGNIVADSFQVSLGHEV